MHLQEEKIRDNVVGNLPSKSKNIIGHSQQIELVSGYPSAQAQFRLKEKIDQSTKLEPIAGLQEAVNKSQDGGASGSVGNPKGYDHFTENSPIQRSILIDNELWVNNEDLQQSDLNTEANRAAIMESIGSLDNLEEPPGDIQAAIIDPRTFYLRRDGDTYEADVTNFGEAQEDQQREHLVVNTAPDFIHRSDVDQAMTIGGLISCVALIIEAGNDAGTQLLIGMHFTTGYHTGQDDALNARGTSALQAMQLLSDGFQITRVHLCHPLQFNAFNLQGRVHENTTTNLDALRAFFGNGICQTHVLGQTQVTAQLGTDGEVAIDV